MFTDSSCKREWSCVMLDALVEDPGARKRLRALPFDAAKHSELCSELKLLYTAITRCRLNLYDRLNYIPYHHYYCTKTFTANISHLS